MTASEYRSAVDDIIYLCSCAVKGTDPDPDIVASFDLDSMYFAAQRHMLTAMVGMTLQSAGVDSQPFRSAAAAAQRKAVILGSELQSVTAALEAAGIWYMPLKGAVIQGLYPKYGMREMADHDILIDAGRAEDVRAVMEGLGFQVRSFGIGNDDSYIKPPVSNFEMHTSLFGDKHDKKLTAYYQNVKERLLKDEGNACGYHFSPEDFYIFMAAHAYKHYDGSGIGLRSLIDTYVYLAKNDLDIEYVERETAKLGIDGYERLSRSLALALFAENEPKELDEDQQDMLDYIVSSGTFGSMEHKVGNTIRKTGKGKFRYLCRRIFGPLGRDDPERNQFKRRYAVFFRYPILLPLLPFYRLFRALKQPKRLKAEAKALRKIGKT